METKEIAGQGGKRDIQGKDAPRRKSKNTSHYQEMAIRRPVCSVFKGEKRQPVLGMLMVECLDATGGEGGGYKEKEVK